jgi:hypothetical protein
MCSSGKAREFARVFECVKWWWKKVISAHLLIGKEGACVFECRYTGG